MMSDNIIDIDTKNFDDDCYSFDAAREIIEDIHTGTTYTPTPWECDFMNSILEQEHNLTIKQTEVLNRIFDNATRR